MDWVNLEEREGGTYDNRWEKKFLNSSWLRPVGMIVSLNKDWNLVSSDLQYSTVGLHDNRRLLKSRMIKNDCFQWSFLNWSFCNSFPTSKGTNLLITASFLSKQIFIHSLRRPFLKTDSEILIISPLQMCIHKYKVLARFGLMHMIGTNLCVWLRVVIKEALMDLPNATAAAVTATPTPPPLLLNRSAARKLNSKKTMYSRSLKPVVKKFG